MPRLDQKTQNPHDTRNQEARDKKRADVESSKKYSQKETGRYRMWVMNETRDTLEEVRAEQAAKQQRANDYEDNEPHDYYEAQTSYNF